MWNFFKYTSGTTIDKKWMVMERIEALSSGSLRSPFSLRKLAQVIPCNFYSQMIHKKGAQTLRKKSIPSDFRFSFSWLATRAAWLILSSSILSIPSVLCLKTSSKWTNAMNTKTPQSPIDVGVSTHNQTPRTLRNPSSILRKMHARNILGRYFRFHC